MLKIKNLSLSTKKTEILRDLNFDIQENTIHALIGESGSGKSITSMAILGLLPSNIITSPESQIYYQDTNIIGQEELYRGKKINYIPQQPINSLNPIRTIRSQLTETIKYYYPDYSQSQIDIKIHDLLTIVQLDNQSTKVLNNYSFELSGGMCQRILIALSLISQPEFLIADEPTTALDVITQAEILNLLQNLMTTYNLTILFITHDLALAAKYSHNATVLFNGQAVESGLSQNIFSKPNHEYTQQLLELTKQLQ